MEKLLVAMQKTEPVKLARNIKAILAVASLMGWIGFSQNDVALLGTQLEIIIPAVNTILAVLVEWYASSWLRKRVSPESTTAPMAKAIQTITLEHPELVQPAAQKAAARVLG